MDLQETQTPKDSETLFRDVELDSEPSHPPAVANSIKPLHFIQSIPSTVSAFAAGVMRWPLKSQPPAPDEIPKSVTDAVPDAVPEAVKQSAQEDVETDVEESIESAEPSTTRKRTSRADDKYKKWKNNSLMIWNKIADHRDGNIFMKRVRDEEYNRMIKEPMTLEMVKSRIREGVIDGIQETHFQVIKTTAEFHRDLSLIFANAVMYNDEDSDVYAMAIEIKSFVDTELKNLLINSDDL